MKSFHYFKFVPSDYMMGKIQRCSYQAQAEFIRLCCLYWNSEGYYSLEDAEIECEKLDELFKRKIITEEEGFIVIDFLDVQLEEIKEIRQKRSNAGKEGAIAKKKKAQDKQNEASAKQVLNKTKHSIEEHSIEEDKIKKDIEQRKQAFLLDLSEFKDQYNRNLLNEFYSYWTEHGKNDKKMRFEKQKSFSLSRRLTTWKKNENKFNNGKSDTNTGQSALDWVDGLGNDVDSTGFNTIDTDYTEF